jgi:hypothetical protein
MTAENETERRNDPHEAEPVQQKAPWKTPQLIVQGTITVRTLGKSLVDLPSG